MLVDLDAIEERTARHSFGGESWVSLTVSDAESLFAELRALRADVAKLSRELEGAGKALFEYQSREGFFAGEQVGR
jgi:hypothetical protein